MAFNVITPSQRVSQFPDDLHLKDGGKLWCIWCDRELGYKRKDAIMDHFKSTTHTNNKASRKKSSAPISGRQKTESLRKLFEESDSDSSTSFEGFDSPVSSHKDSTQSSNYSTPNQEISVDESRKSGRSRKRPARLSDDVTTVPGVADQAAFISTMAKRRKTESDSSSSLSSTPPIRMRSMPIKKQLSFSARKPDLSPPTSPVQKDSLKMKFSRKPGKQPDNSAEKNVKVVTKPAGGKGLKLKFIWKKKNTAKSPRDSNNISQVDSDGEVVEDAESSAISTGMDEDVPVVEDRPDVSAKQRVTHKSKEVLTPMTPKLNITQSKYDAVKSTQSKSDASKRKSTDGPPPKRPKTKKTPPVPDDKKRKLTAYMIWAKPMREKITKQYPGLEFADVSKKLGDMWKKLPDKAKQMIKVKAMTANPSRSISTTATKKGGRMIETGPKRHQQPSKQISSPPPPPIFADPQIAMDKELSRLSAPSTEPLDSAAYFSLLGESFSNLSAKTKTGTQTIQGADTVLLDSLLCAMVPLISLLRQIPELQDCVDQATLKNCFSNIAHIVPGL